MVKFGVRGFEDAPESAENPGGNKKQEFWMVNGQTKRILFLDEDFFGFWGHALWFWNKERDFVVCPSREKFPDPRCPICSSGEKSQWPRFMAHYTVIDMGDVNRGDDGEVSSLEGYYSEKTKKTYQFGRKIFGAKLGSKEKEGTQQLLRRKHQQKGGLKWTVWDVYRAGDKAPRVGSEFEFVTKLKSEEEVLAYLEKWGCDTKTENFTIDPYEYEEIFQPYTFEMLDNIVASKIGRRGGGGDSGGNQPFSKEDGDVAF